MESGEDFGAVIQAAEFVGDILGWWWVGLVSGGGLGSWVGV
jgi:hypothetical protein